MSMFSRERGPARTTVGMRPSFNGDGLVRAEGVTECSATMAHKRVNNGLLARGEKRALHWLAERTPVWIEPDHLTIIGVAGAILVMIGFASSHISPKYLALAIFGLFLNWYGDSLDGTLARYRGVERPRFGYFIDHSCDLISQTFIFMGLGLSPYFTLFSAALALSMYMLMSSYTYLKVMILKTHQLSYGGMGATELRVAIACWGILAVWIGPLLRKTKFINSFTLDQVVFTMWIIVFLIFISMVISDQKKFRNVIDIF